ncbi:MAG: DUF2007 domain-containing protein, partial [Planctomycetota bacterium]|nr:DUF2007 domain-containing protein [Planctomycetota bacterium]
MPPKRHRLRRVRAGAAPDAPEAVGAVPRLVREGLPADPDLVLLVHADDMAEAQRYKSELQGHGIPAAVEGEMPGGIRHAGRGVPVLVSETLADEAAEVIAELEFTRPQEGPVDDK